MTDEFRFLDSLQGSGIRPGLSRMRAFLRAAGRPERTFKSIIVAGTNGKGSTSATLASILTKSGYTTALYTSPHLVDIRERWRFGANDVTEDDLRDAIRRLRDLSARVGFLPTYFEALTLLAFLLFENRCEVAVLEVGMGGRLDATNVVRPIASVITAVGIDHTQYLGSTIRKIAFEKAGVIHRGAVALTSNSDEEVLAVIRARCAKFGIPLHETQKEVKATGVSDSDERLSFRLTTPLTSYDLSSPLVGTHQVENVSLAVRAAEELRTHLTQISREVIAEGVSATKWRGRLERIDAGGKSYWVDGAHNPHAVERIVKFVDAHFPESRCLVFGMMSDKEVQRTAELLFTRFDEIIVTRADPARGATTDELQRIARSLGKSVRIAPDPASALGLAAVSGAKAVLVCGSLYLAGDAIRILDEKRQGTHRVSIH